MFKTLTLAIWLGIYALRSYVPSAVWNMADELPLSYKALFAVGTHLIGILGVLVIRYSKTRLLNPLACAFGIVMVARQIFIADDNIGPWLSLLSWVLWLWFMMSLADEVSAHDAERWIAPAVAAAVALQVGMQSAWHGLDLQSVSGPVAIAASSLLAIALCYSVTRIDRVQLRRPDASIAWIALGVALFLEVTLIANAGRFSQITQSNLPAAVAVIQLGAALAVYAAARMTAFPLRVLFVALGFIATFGVMRINGPVEVLLVAVQIVTICGVREAAEVRVRWSGATIFAVGGLIYFGLIFAFYNYYEMPVLWIMCFAALSVLAVLAQRDGTRPQRAAMLAFVPAFVLTALYFLPPPATSGPRAGELTVLSYNIHHGFDDDGVPGMQRTVDEIAAINADLIGFQEIGRGWNLLGGNDLISYLAWRFPDYTIHYAPTNGQLWGNAIMSRLPVLSTGGQTFSAEPGAFRYGFANAIVTNAADTMAFISVHLTADLAGPSGDARLEQAQMLMQHAMMFPQRQQIRVIVAGDFNAYPIDAPVVHVAKHLTDLGAAARLGELPTWPAGNPSQRIDYIFGSGFDVLGGEVRRTTASDHLPVIVRLPDTTRRFAASSNAQSFTASSIQ